MRSADADSLGLQQPVQLMDVNVNNLRIFWATVGIGGPDLASKRLSVDSRMPPHCIEDASLDRRQDKILRDQSLSAAGTNGEIGHAISSVLPEQSAHAALSPRHAASPRSIVMHAPSPLRRSAVQATDPAPIRTMPVPGRIEPSGR